MGQRGVVLQKTGEEMGLVSFWLKHGQFTQNVSFARDLCIAAQLEVVKQPKERTPSTATYLTLSSIPYTSSAVWCLLLACPYVI